MSKLEKIKDQEIKKLLLEMNKKHNLMMARLNKIHHDFLNFVKEHQLKKDQKRLSQLRKDILNK